jgi:glycosidase
VEYNSEETVDPLSVQMDDPGSMYNLYKGLVYLRNHSPALTYGGVMPVEDGSEKVISFIRNGGGESLLVIHNLSDSNQNIFLPSEYQNYNKIVWQSNKEHPGDRVKSLSPFNSIILRTTEK